MIVVRKSVARETFIATVLEGEFGHYVVAS